MNPIMICRHTTLHAVFAGLLMVAGALGWQPATAAIILIEAPGMPLEEDQPFTFRVSVDETEGEVFGGFEASLRWNPGDLTVEDASFGSLLGDDFDSLQIVDTFADGLEILQISFLFDDELDFLQGGLNSFELFSLSLIANMSGVVLVDWTLDLISADGFSLQSFSGATPVPTPGTALLFGSGLLGMLLYPRRRRTSRTVE